MDKNNSTTEPSQKSRRPITWKCYRIRNVPSSWERITLLERLKTVDHSLNNLQIEQLQLYPACSGNTQAGLLHREESPEYFQILETESHILIEVEDPTDEEEPAILEVDCHFHNLTPLNNPGENVAVDIFAVTGLAGHAYGSWTNSKTHKMWLQHFLPKDLCISNARIMTYGYNTRLIKDVSQDTWLEYRRNFIQQLTNARGPRVAERPIIFIGHSLGGILILQGLLQTYLRQADHGHILDATRAILFFGTPHQGLESTEELRAMVEDSDMTHSEKSSRISLLKQISKDSSFLHLLSNDIFSIVDKFKMFGVYETLPTPSVKKDPITGIWARTGDSRIVVEQFSAFADLKGERHPFRRNHTQLVKFETAADDDYRTVISFLTKILEEISLFGGGRVKPGEGDHAVKSQKISYIIPMKLPFPRNDNFTGRKSELDKIHRELQDTNSGTPRAHLKFVVLYGLGGIGKTQIAAQYAYSHEEEYTSIWWLNASTTAALSQGLVDIAQELITNQAQIQIMNHQKPDYCWIAGALGLPPAAVSQTGEIIYFKDNTNVFIKAVQNWLVAKDNRKWLLILDSYDDLVGVKIGNFLPTNSAGGNVLITSRASSSSRLGKGIEVSEVEDEDAIEILRKSGQLPQWDANQTEDRNKALDIVKKLGALPLALEQAGAYISARQITSAKFLTLLDNKFPEIAAKRPPNAVWNYRDDTVFTTWEISFNALTPDAQELLLLCAFLDNEDIWEGLFQEEILKSELGIESVDNALIELFNFSLAKRKNTFNTQESFWIHPLVHWWSRERLNRNKKERKALDVISLVVAVAESLNDSTGIRSIGHWELEKTLMPHIEKCYSHICHNSHFSLSGTEADYEVLYNAAILAEILSEHSRLSQARDLNGWVLGGCVILGEDHPDTLSIVHNMAVVLYKQEKYEEALEWHQRVLSARTKTLGDDHPDTFETACGISMALCHQEKYDEAIELFGRTFKAQVDAVGDNLVDTFQAAKLIAKILGKKGEYGRGIELLEWVLDGQAMVFGDNHPYTELSAVFLEIYKMDGIEKSAGVNQASSINSDLEEHEGIGITIGMLFDFL